MSALSASNPVSESSAPGLSTGKLISKYILGVGFIVAGANHFLHGPLYVRAMPLFLPKPLALVYLSGVFEIALGALLLAPAYTVAAAWGLIALLVAVFPANVHMALHTPEFPYPPALLYLRLPLQGVLIAWVYWLTWRCQPTPEPLPRLPPR